MDANIAYRKLLSSTEAAYRTHPEMIAFADFPEVVQPQDTAPHHRPVSDMMREDRRLQSHTYTNLVDAILNAAPHMLWRTTYDARSAFMERWGCFTVLGDGGPFAALGLRVFVVYMPEGLYYPSHRHPAEEMYLVVAGRARFCRAGMPDDMLGEGQTVFHASDQIHAIETIDSPMLSLVTWRNHLTVPPVLVPDADRAP